MLEKVASLFALEFTVAFSQAAVNGFTAYGFPKFVFSEMKDIHVVEDVWPAKTGVSSSIPCAVRGLQVRSI